MTSYLDGHGTKVTPQSEKISGSKQSKNRAGGFAYEIDDFARLRRFLILGTEGGTYYAGQRELTLENADVVRRCLKENARKTLSTIVDISEAGRAPKNDPAIFALALAASDQDDEVRKAALKLLPDVCRIGTHLFMFAGFLEQFRGWGRGARRAVGGWYDRDDLAYQVVKYRNRGGWSHRDLLRLAHPKPKRVEQQIVFDFVVRGKTEAGLGVKEAPIAAFLRAQEAETSADTVKLIREYGGSLPREALKTEHLADPEVWKALIPRLPITALIRNLGTMTRNGALKPMAPEVAEVVSMITDDERLIKGRVHPISVLAALKTYQAGGLGGRGRGGAYDPIAGIVDALDDAFYKAFGAVDSTGKSIMLAIDVSGSMTWENLMGIPGLDPRTAAGALAMVTQKTESNTLVTAFSNGSSRSRWSNTGYELGSGITPVDISSRKRLDDVIRTINAVPMGGTDCALPMLYATANELNVDAFVIYTDNETWAGDIHPSQALREYRRKFNRPDAKLVVVGMTATGFSIADPDDGGMLDVVGFDTATPQLISEFISG